MQIRLLMDAVGRCRRHPGEAESLGRAIADMHPCESSWWYACARNRNQTQEGVGCTKR